MTSAGSRYVGSSNIQENMGLYKFQQKAVMHAIYQEVINITYSSGNVVQKHLYTSII